MIYGYSTVDEAVNAALYLENSKLLRSVVLFRMITSLLATVAMTSVYSFVGNMRAHKGLVLLLRIHYFWTHALCSCAFWDATLIAYQSLSWKNPEDLLDYGTLCFFRKIPYSLAVCGGAASLLIIVLERRHASRYVRTYEAAGYRVALRLVFFQAIYLLAFFIGCWFLYDYELIYAYCTIVTPRSEKFISFFAMVLLLIQVFVMVVFRWLLRRNVNFLQSGDGCLNERYQIKENIRTLNLLVPLVGTQFALSLFPVIMWFLYAMIPHGFDSRVYPIFEECINIIQLYGIIMPLLLFHSQRKSQQRAKHELSMNNNSKVTDNHLKKIQLNW